MTDVYAEIEAIRQCHKKQPASWRPGDGCYRCLMAWPCDVARLLALIDERDYGDPRYLKATG